MLWGKAVLYLMIMKVSFRKMTGHSDLGISFFWMLKIDTEASLRMIDYLIPELFYDYLYVHEGAIQYADLKGEHTSIVPQQTLKTIHNHSLVFTMTTPLVLFGARLSLPFAELFWQTDITQNSFIEQSWVERNLEDFSAFASQCTKAVQTCRDRKVPEPMLSSMLEESEWLAQYSDRHKRRLYKTVFGMSRKDMVAIQKVHSFLDQTCEFTPGSPRIIEYVDADTFYDQPHLNRAFKKVTGLSPLGYFEANSILQDNLMAASYNENMGPFRNIST